MKKLTKSDVRMNNAMAGLIMIVIGLVGIYALSRSVFYDNSYTNDLATTVNCGLITSSSTSSGVQNCIMTDINNGGHDRSQAQIYEIAGTAMITAAVVSFVTVMQNKRTKN